MLGDLGSAVLNVHQAEVEETLKNGWGFDAWANKWGNEILFTTLAMDNELEDGQNASEWGRPSSLHRYNSIPSSKIYR
jgi:hypothetical protein